LGIFSGLLITRARFELPPSDDVVRAFLAHVRDTGQPETFDLISTTKPPKDGAVVALRTSISVPLAKRPLRDRAPCPICSPANPKFLANGTLLWCESSKAIYCIGPDCYSTWWDDGRFDQALNALRRTQQELTNAGKLEAFIAQIADQRDWIARNLAQARRIAELHADLIRSAPKFRGTLSRRLKGSLSTHGVRGDGFLRGQWPLERKLTDADRLLVALQHGSRDVSKLSPSAVKERLQDAARAEASLKFVYERMSEAAVFLSADNMRKLAELGKWDGLMARFDTIWRTSIGVAAPSPQPVRTL